MSWLSVYVGGVAGVMLLGASGWKDLNEPKAYRVVVGSFGWPLLVIYALLLFLWRLDE